MKIGPLAIFYFLRRQHIILTQGKRAPLKGFHGNDHYSRPAALLAFWVARIYNQLVELQNRHENGFSQIEVQLKRRYDLIPNLVETAKAYMNHERETLEAVINARNDAVAGLAAAAGKPGDAAAMSELAGAEGILGSAMSRFNVTMEAYPDLKASANMAQLSEELTSTERSPLPGRPLTIR